MKAANPFLKRNELVALCGIAGDGGTGDGEFDADARFDRFGDDGVVSEDLLDLIRIGGIALGADVSGEVIRKAGTAKAKGVGRLRHQRQDRDFVDAGFRKPDHEAEFAQRLFDAEEPEVVSVSCGELIGSGLQAEREDKDLGAFDILQEVRIGAFDGQAGFSSGHDSGGILYPIEDAVVDLLIDIVDGDRGAGIAETAAAAVAGSGRKQGVVGSEDVEIFSWMATNQQPRGGLFRELPGTMSPEDLSSKPLCARDWSGRPNDTCGFQCYQFTANRGAVNRDQQVAERMSLDARMHRFIDGL